ncbi:hypothetical protein GTU79_23510 [Sodalis ligni]|uniref:hypothetical protein n=1 Tax=Sodalis ligni TaxID=2697027 RepID=UPI001BDF5DB5|nr:hypothetical protein [Sodalis ligni]QWA10188.1 hypothetical protein GTU79_23510 [Sodalis ligni]
MKNKNNFALIILNLIIFFILCYALLQNGIWRGHDWLAHFQRLISLNEELDAQQFPPLFNYWLPGQFGYSWQLFYPPLTSFLFLLARIITFNSTDNILQMKIVLFIIFVIAFICAFYAGKREHNSSAAGYLCTILFITSGYFLTNIFIRFALGEMLAMAFMPCSSEDAVRCWGPQGYLADTLQRVGNCLVQYAQPDRYRYFLFTVFYNQYQKAH